MTAPALVAVVVFAALAHVDVASAAPRQVAPDLSGVAVDSLEYRAAQTRYDTSASALASAQEVASGSTAQLQKLQTQDSQLTGQLATQTTQKKQATVDLAAARTSLRAIAVSTYVNGSPDDPTADEDLEVATQHLAQRGLSAAVSTDQADRATAAGATVDRLTRAMADALAQRTTVRQAMVEAQRSQQQAAADVARYTEAVSNAQVDLDIARVTATVVDADFQLVAFDAYRRAAASMALSNPSCGIPWWALAGITRVESRHGQFGGAMLLYSGNTSQPIIGIPLDGENDTALIADTDGGSLDGDPVYDHAVGPMQFIPSTWRRWARDGNGDGVADPNNIYDAAATAARYLCASGPMQTDADMTRGFLSYNHSDAYAANVLRFAKGYAALTLPST